METLLQDLNYAFGDTIGIVLIDPKEFISLIIRFVLNFTVVSVISRCFYYPKSKRRDYMFIFILMSTSIFLLVNLMGDGAMKTGAALGLFAIFGIIRYRTEAIPIREMTYLFMLVAVSVVNAMGQAKYHSLSDRWDGMGLITLLFANCVFILMAWLFESSKILSDSCSKYIKYDKIDLIKPSMRKELIEDLKARTGLDITSVSIGSIDFLKDMALIKIYYNTDEEDESAQKMPKEYA